MRSRTLSQLLLASVLILFACNRSRPATMAPGPATAPEAPVAAPLPTPTKTSGALDPAALATMDPGGTDAVDTAIGALAARVRHNPKADNWIELGQAWVRKARETADPVYYLNADACAQQALAVDPRNFQAIELQVLLQLSNHEFEKARATGEAALAKRPDLPLMLGLVSDADLELGDYTATAKRLGEMMDLKPALPSYSRVSYFHWLHGEEKEALESARLAIDSGDPKQPEALAWVLVQAALIFWQRGDYAGADAGFDRALITFPEFPPALVGKGRVALAHNAPGPAADFFARAFKRSPLIETAGLLVDARTAVGDTAGAAETAKLIAERGPASDPRTTALYWATHNQETTHALQLASDERRTRDDLYTEDTYAWALYRAGKPTEARAASDKALILQTPDARLLYHAGAIRIAQGQRDSGIALVKRALALNPSFDFTGAREAKELLKQ